MPDIRVTTNMSAETIRQELRSFSLFSAVEAYTDTHDRTVVLHEVTLSERMHRFCFQSQDERQQNVRKSQQALLSLASSRPDIGKLLGKSILLQQSWASGDLRKALKTTVTPLKPAENGRGLQVPITEQGQVGITTAKLSNIEADCKIVWNSSPPAAQGQLRARETAGEQSPVEIFVTRTDEPGEDELRSAYRMSLAAAKGHVVISPIDDVPHGKRAVKITRDDGTEPIVDARCCSDASLRLLVEAIDEAKCVNPLITSVTIAAREYPDKSLPFRISAMHATLTAARQEAADAGRVLMPASLRLFGRDLPNNMQVKMAGLDAHDVIMKETPLLNVRTCVGQPGKLAADTAFLEFSQLHALAESMARDGKKEFPAIYQVAFDPHGAVRPEVDAIRKAQEDKWGIEALELPSGELPASRLFGMHSVAPQISTEKYRQFFLEHLKDMQGRVVVELTGNPAQDAGVWAALQEIRNSGKGSQCEFILAAESPEAVEGFHKIIDARYPLTERERATVATPPASPGKPAANTGKFQPKGNAQAPGWAGMHFLTNPALELQAGRTIVPLAMVLEKRLEAVAEAEAVSLPSLDTGRLIAFDDDFMTSPEQSSPKGIRDRMLSLLSGFTGSVVISPPDCNDKQLQAIVSAVHAACGNNRKLSVSFAAEGRELQDKLTAAYVSVLNDIADARDLDIDEEPEEQFIIPAELWKRA